MKVLVIGGGGREHALAWKIAVSSTHLRDHETRGNLVCRLVLEKKQ